ncbi:hypothetical protein ColTof3_14688 [Colletotrichum tofieldiae]|nr:hypothetical protein ColTof3_14688 [Colletotrichum tofieldiae]
MEAIFRCKSARNTAPLGVRFPDETSSEDSDTEGSEFGAETAKQNSDAQTGACGNGGLTIPATGAGAADSTTIDVEVVEVLCLLKTRSGNTQARETEIWMERICNDTDNPIATTGMAR